MRLVILGAGGFGKTVADIAEQTGRYDCILFLDDALPTAVGRCAAYTEFADATTEMFPAFGNNEMRLAWMDRLLASGIPLATIIHPTAYISPKAILKQGIVVLPQAVINTATVVKRGCIVNCGAIIDHNCILEEGVHICLGGIVKADNRIPRCMKVEAGSVIQNHAYPLELHNDTDEIQLANE